LGRTLTRLDRGAARTVLWLDEHLYLGSVLRVFNAVLIAIIPTAQAYSDTARTDWVGKLIKTFADPRWLGVFFLAVIVLFPLQHYHGGAPRRRLLASLARVNGSFAGSLLSFGQKTDATAKRKLDDSQCETLCAGLLHRIRDLTAIATGVESTPRLRATLAVPYSTLPGGVVDALRVWCYDETHGDRGFTTIPLVMNGSVAPGAPAAYLSGEAQVISDINLVPGAGTRPYRSILSLPLATRSDDGRPLAVVSIDADEPNFFDRKDVVEDVRPLISPVVTAIGLVLLARQKKGQPYVFPQ
jgi:hypothetical protein